MRGNLLRHDRRRDGRGSIPAGAGQPTAIARSTRPATVYPRGCGATRYMTDPHGTSWGLSPRVRGNRCGVPVAARRAGSIPAGAGQPPRRFSPRSGSRVYPRGCGATSITTAVVSPFSGLSPRVRGNPAAAPGRRARVGSIPAGAGQPPCTSRPWRCSRVYPRGCGATRRDRPARSERRGLSPRVRGNRQIDFDVTRGNRSIPAGAGQPCPASARNPRRRVYPRGCGATAAIASRISALAGLSPRVRGNPQRLRGDRGADGSIPAGAGQPRTRSWSGSWRWVYPRGCGATPCRTVELAPLRGLSPRVRGNPEAAIPLRRLRGSIPAGAGQPVLGTA